MTLRCCFFCKIFAVFVIFLFFCDIFNTGCKTMKKRNRVFSFLDVSIIVIICSFVMCFLGASLVYKHLGGVNFSLLDEDEGLKEFIGAYNNLLDNYYATLDKKDLINGAIAGMYEVTGDPYTTYLDPNSANSLDESLEGTYKGIGIKMMQIDDGHVIVTRVYSDTPAEKAGLRSGDIITKVGDREFTAGNQKTLTKIIMSGEEITLTFLRDEKENTVNIKAVDFMKPSVYSQVFERNGKKVGYLSLEVFSETADIQFGNELTKLENANIDSLILDLRSNSGGYLQVAENIAEMFLEKGKAIYSLKNKDSVKTTKDNTAEKRNYSIVVLTNNGSASASEILAAALKYSYGATLIGDTTYGKGKVQERSNLSNGTGLKYTTAEWLTPNGDCIDGKGLTPDINISLDRTTYNELDMTTDNQLVRALEYLAG
ncbi:MAG TPA: hypothetical protein DCY94_04830 [Firmicutes bacterium]|nr:hypothetical protein [Bacillota bacterium]